jgi:hypothetical protein
VNVTTPVVGFTVYVPSPATVIEVFVQLGAVSTGDTPHNFTDDPTNVAGDEGESFVKRFNVNTSSFGPAT